MVRVGDSLGRPIVRALDDAPANLRPLRGVLDGMSTKKRGDRDGVNDVDRFDAPSNSSSGSGAPDRPDWPGSGSSGSGAPRPDLPTVTFSRSRAPGLAENFDAAVAGGAPTTLTRADMDTKLANRDAALDGVPKAPKGQSLDEYPFASTVEGGAGATVRPVPVSEQNYQGGKLSSFYRQHNIKPGDQINVAFGP